MLFEIVGFSAVFQQTPRDVTSAEPSSVIFPPDDAVVCVISVALVVVATGKVVAFFLHSVKLRTEKTIRIRITVFLDKWFISVSFN